MITRIVETVITDPIDPNIITAVVTMISDQTSDHDNGHHGARS